MHTEAGKRLNNVEKVEAMIQNRYPMKNNREPGGASGSAIQNEKTL